MSAFFRPETATALDAAADQLEGEARRLRRRAADARRRLTDAHARGRADQSAQRLARTILASGAPLSAVTRALETSMPTESAIRLAQIAARTLKRERLQQRDEAVMRMKRAGLLNRDIAQRLGLHEKSVARIAGKMRRAAARPGA